MKFYQLVMICVFCVISPLAASAQGPFDQAASQLVGSLDASQAQKLSKEDTQPLEFLKPSQYKLYADFAKGMGAYADLGILKPGMTDKQIVALPVWINFILAASIAVQSGNQETTWEPAFKYSHPTPAPAQKLTSSDNANFNRFAHPRPNVKLAVNRKLFQSVKPLMLAGYPAGLPIPESAYINQVHIPFSALSPAQQKFVKSVILNSEDALPEPFDWSKATVSFARTLHYRGTSGVHQPPLYAKFTSFHYQVW